MKYKLYNPSNGVMNVAGFMSGSGSNLIKIIEREKELKKEKGKSPYQMKVIFSDTYDSNATKIGKEFDIPIITRDIKSFYKHRNKSRRDMQVREEFDLETIKALQPFEISVIAYGGYMSIVSPYLASEYLGINVHPADLSILDEKGARKFVGDNAVWDAIVAEEDNVRSSTHIIEPKVDGGRILMISEPLKLERNIIGSYEGTDKEYLTKLNQNKLKEIGDWVIFPKTIRDIAEGKFEMNHLGNLYYEGELIPNGLKLN
ncbi:MAG: formyltransferase family protein [Candidatus Woesearchaeota archaeon]